MLKALTILSVLIGLSILTGCGARTVIEHQTINYVFEPEVYQHCQDEPAVPEKGATNRDGVQWTESVRSAGQDCRDKVNGGREWQLDRRNKLDLPDAANTQPSPPAPDTILPSVSFWHGLWHNSATPPKPDLPKE